MLRRLEAQKAVARISRVTGQSLAWGAKPGSYVWAKGGRERSKQLLINRCYAIKKKKPGHESRVPNSTAGAMACTVLMWLLVATTFAVNREGKKACTQQDYGTWLRNRIRAILPIMRVRCEDVA